MKSVQVIFVATFVASLLIAAYEAAVALELQEDTKCGKCTYNGKEYEQGAIWQAKGECKQMRCGRHDDKRVLIQHESCGAVLPGPGMVKVPGDSSLPYPECCPQIVRAPKTPHHA